MAVATAATAATSAAPADAPDQVSFKYVYIPADAAEPIQERSLSCRREGNEEVMAFLNMCKRHFRRASSGASDEQEAARRKAFKASLGDKAAGVSDDMLNMLAGQQMVEPIALLANSPETGFVGVYAYCDDQATFKQLPPNPRATQIVAEAGQALQICGDVFIGRYFDDEDNFRRLDFTLAELNSSAGWLREAREQLARRSQRSGDAQALLQRMQPQAAASAPGAGAAPAAAAQQPPAEAERARGNEAFKRGDWQSALEHYTAALKLDRSSTAARNNRALAYTKVGKYEEAAADCSTVLEAEPGNVKALLRRAAAYEGLARPADAVVDLEAALRLQPRNADALKRLAALQQEPGGGEGA